MWFVLPLSIFFLYICCKPILSIFLFSISPMQILIFCLELMFLDSSQFLYEPDHYNWKDAVEPDYWFHIIFIIQYFLIIKSAFYTFGLFHKVSQSLSLNSWKFSQRYRKSQNSHSHQKLSNSSSPNLKSPQFSNPISFHSISIKPSKTQGPLNLTQSRSKPQNMAK